MDRDRAIARPPLRFRRPSRMVEDLRRMEQAEGECQRSAERTRYIFTALTIGVAPLMFFFLGGLASAIPIAGDSLGMVFAIPGFVSLIALLPAQFAVFQKACNSMHLQKLDRVAISVFCMFFSFGPIVTVITLLNATL